MNPATKPHHPITNGQHHPEAAPNDQPRQTSEPRMMRDPHAFARVYAICLADEDTGEVLAAGPRISLVEAERFSALGPEAFGLAIQVQPLDMHAPAGKVWNPAGCCWDDADQTDQD